MLYPPFIGGSGKSGSQGQGSITFELDTLQNMYVENAVMDAAAICKALVSILF